jgi:TRAP-type mannitol/chloroaromatic compound transport system permease small subunit
VDSAPAFDAVCLHEAVALGTFSKIEAGDFMGFLKSLSSWIDRLNQWVGNFVAWTTGIVVAVVFTDVVMRYVFNTSFVFTQELEWHLFAFIFLMGAGNTLLKDGHVRVDIFYQRLQPKSQAWINLLGVIFFLIPGCYMVIATSLPFVQASYAIMEGSPDPGGIPYRWVLKACIPAGFILLLLQGISLGIKSLLTIMGVHPAEQPEGN